MLKYALSSKQTYVLDSPDRNVLLKHGFQFYDTSESGEVLYRLQWLRKQRPSFLYEIICNVSTGQLTLNLYDANEEQYFPYYCNQFGNRDPLFTRIDQVFLKRLAVLNAYYMEKGERVYVSKNKKARHKRLFKTTS